jgi:hypothetical protein
VYRATVSGVNKSNYTTLAGGVLLQNVSPGFNDHPIQPGTTYYYVVTSLIGAAESSESKEVSYSVAPLPAPVAGITVTGNGSGSINVTWPPVVGAYYYVVYVDGTAVANPFNPGATITGLKSGTNVTVNVQAATREYFLGPLGPNPVQILVP